MKLKIMLPRKMLLEEEVDKVTVEAPDGAVTLKERHIDFVSSIVPGILRGRLSENGRYIYAAVDRGILVKRGDTLLISTRQGIRSDDLSTLHTTVREEFARLNKRERQMQTTLARLESNFVQRFIELERR